MGGSSSPRASGGASQADRDRGGRQGRRQRVRLGLVQRLDLRRRRKHRRLVPRIGSTGRLGLIDRLGGRNGLLDRLRLPDLRRDDPHVARLLRRLDRLLRLVAAASPETAARSRLGIGRRPGRHRRRGHSRGYLGLGLALGLRLGLGLLRLGLGSFDLGLRVGPGVHDRLDLRLGDGLGLRLGLLFGHGLRHRLDLGHRLGLRLGDGFRLGFGLDLRLGFGLDLGHRLRLDRLLQLRLHLRNGLRLGNGLRDRLELRRLRVFPDRRRNGLRHGHRDRCRPLHPPRGREHRRG